MWIVQKQYFFSPVWKSNPECAVKPHREFSDATAVKESLIEKV